MTLPNNRRRDPGGASSEAILVWLAIVLVVVVVGGVYAAMHLGHRLASTGADLPGDPFTVLFGLLGGDLAWPGAAGWWVIAAGAALLVFSAIATGLVIHRIRGGRSRVDRAARYMGRGRDVQDLTRKHAQGTATRLGVSSSPGVPIGRTVARDEPLYGSWEDMHIDIWGPRTGKTTSRAVPAILEAPGSVLVTSNKRDVVDATRDVRAKAGPVWVFDPQSITLERPSWWWNPLSYVTDEVRAAKLADHFATGSRDPGAKTDAYFDPAGQDLLAGLLLAAALDHRPITDVYTWLTRPTDETAVDILQEHEYSLTADQVAGAVSAPEKQRGGVYGTAQQMASCLTNRQVARWVTPQGMADPRRQFRPEDFVRADGGTLYSLSKEGRGTAGPLVTALTVAVVEAAEELAATSRGGRLSTPLLGVLDEAANVCRWRDLPNLYSHYGSRGIVLMTILQSWSQGVEVWGESGMKKLWSASNVKVYGGGVSEAGFLEDLSRMIGDYDRLSSSTSHGRGQRTVSQQLHRERILDVADLAALPKGRAVVMASGSRPTLIRTQPWMSGPHAGDVEGSIAAHDPQAEPARSRRGGRDRSNRWSRGGVMSDWAEEDLEDDGIDAQAVEGDDDAGGAAQPALYYGSVDEFIREYLRHVYSRRIDGRSRVWAARWWEYDEAVIRLEALWRAWEHLRRDPAIGMSVWWRDHADYHMGVLMDPGGPFLAADASAEVNQSKKGAPLPYEQPPPCLFPDLRDGGPLHLN